MKWTRTKGADGSHEYTSGPYRITRDQRYKTPVWLLLVNDVLSQHQYWTVRECKQAAERHYDRQTGAIA